MKRSHLDFQNQLCDPPMWFMPVNNHTLERLRQEDFEANKKQKQKTPKLKPSKEQTLHGRVTPGFRDPHGDCDKPLT